MFSDDASARAHIRMSCHAMPCNVRMYVCTVDVGCAALLWKSVVVREVTALSLVANKGRSDEGKRYKAT